MPRARLRPHRKPRRQLQRGPCLRHRPLRRAFLRHPSGPRPLRRAHPLAFPRHPPGVRNSALRMSRPPARPVRHRRSVQISAAARRSRRLARPWAENAGSRLSCALRRQDREHRCGRRRLRIARLNQARALAVRQPACSRLPARAPGLAEKRQLIRVLGYQPGAPRRLPRWIPMRVSLKPANIPTATTPMKVASPRASGGRSPPRGAAFRSRSLAMTTCSRMRPSRASAPARATTRRPIVMMSPPSETSAAARAARGFCCWRFSRPHWPPVPWCGSTAVA